VLLVSGDAFVDHPSFGVAVVARLLASFGLRVAVAAQPDWRSPAALAAYSRPRLFVGVTAGNMDSMVNHQTAHRKRRHDDAYSPGGVAGRRPNRAAAVYAHLARQAFPDALILLGGVEASLRRFAHYDYWADELRRSVLLDARADLLVFGMAERPLRAVVDRLAPLARVSRSDAPRLYGIRGTAFVLGKRAADARRLDLSEGAALSFGAHGWAESGPALPAAGLFREAPGAQTWRVRRLPSHDRMAADPLLLASATHVVERSAHPAVGEACVQRHGDAFVIAAPPAWPLTTGELDAVHELPYTRLPDPAYAAAPPPAAAMIACSIQVTRGCFGGCSFCAIGLHEGKDVQSRSRASVLREVAALRAAPVFRGTISDLGGPSANMWRLGCGDPAANARCRRPSCLTPRRCPLLRTDHGPLRELMAAVAAAPGVRHVHVASGVRHDLALCDPGYLDDLVRGHVGGHLHVAPEHTDPTVLRLARKPDYAVFEQFRERFERARRKAGVERYLNPYFVSGLPGSTDERLRTLVARLRADGWRPRQVQSFVPTPGSAATAMFWSGVNPDREGERVEMPRTLAEKLRQHALLTEGVPDTRGAPRDAPRGAPRPPARRGRR
jgi:uncharacterized radical SAM protein YgiQ